MSRVEAFNYWRKWEFGDSASYAEWLKVAAAVIEADVSVVCLRFLLSLARGEAENSWAIAKDK
jgi:hypothetical protein